MLVPQPPPPHLHSSFHESFQPLRSVPGATLQRHCSDTGDRPVSAFSPPPSAYNARRLVAEPPEPDFTRTHTKNDFHTHKHTQKKN